MTDPKIVRERMAAHPYAPDETAQMEFRHLKALDYIAYHLGEIDKHLGSIAVSLKQVSENGSKLEMTTKGVAHMLPTLLRKS
jgi:hypothetical protein